jgi:hypothetical protein
MAREAPSTWIAVRRILGRLRRCRELSLYRFSDSAVGWGKAFDAVVESPATNQAICILDDALEQAGESKPVRSAVREAALAVCENSCFVNLRKVRDNDVLIVRNAAAVRRSLTRRVYSRAAMSLFSAGLSAAAVLAGASIALIAPLMLAAAITAASAWASRRVIARIDRLEVLVALEGPVT